MSVAVGTRMKRVEFVEKLASEVGAGTAWPMLVTLDQLAEILYRVKDAWFTSGSVTTTPGDEPSAGLGLSMGGGTPPSAYISGDGFGAYFIRGYCWWCNTYDDVDLRASDAAYFGAAYGPDLLPASYPSGFEYLSDFFPPTVAPRVTVGESLYRDMADNERGILLPELLDADPMVEDTARINGATLRTAFSQEMFGAEGYAYGITHPAQSQLRLEIYPEVAWVDVNASGNPYDPANELYLKMRFGVIGTASPYDIVALDTMPDSGFHSFVEATDLVFQLAASTCSAKIYFYEEYDGAGASSFASASPFVITAKEWWPYAGTWDDLTGLKL